jgi:DNA-binding XRE family transcriptional regulator
MAAEKITFNRKEAARYLGISETAVRKLEAEKLLTRIVIAGRIVYRREQLDKLVDCFAS